MGIDLSLGKAEMWVNFWPSAYPKLCDGCRGAAGRGLAKSSGGVQSPSRGAATQ